MALKTCSMRSSHIQIARNLKMPRCKYFTKCVARLKSIVNYNLPARVLLSKFCSITLRPRPETSERRPEAVQVRGNDDDDEDEVGRDDPSSPSLSPKASLPPMATPPMIPTTRPTSSPSPSPQNRSTHPSSRAHWHPHSILITAPIPTPTQIQT